MEKYFHAEEAIAIVVEKLSGAFTEQLKVLLEQKHIYQRVRVGGDDIIAAVRPNVFGDDRQGFESGIGNLRFFPSTSQLRALDRDGSEHVVPSILLDNIRLFCGTCKRREAFAPIWFTETTNEISKGSFRRDRGSIYLPPDFQLFLILYQCQICKEAPEGFLLRRHGWVLSLDGRSPIEDMEVPDFIPKAEKHLFRDALIASHGGKTLAALFYLRVFIEQFARRQIGKTDKMTGEEILTAYADTLPLEHRSRMPSLRMWYARLSVALHEAREDEELFEDAKADIEQHFDIRRVFKIPESNSQA